MKNFLFSILVVSLSLSLAFSKEEDWYKVHEEKNIIIFSKKNSEGIMPFKAEGIIKGNIKNLIDIILDFENKNQWSPKLKNVKTHHIINDRERIFSEYYSTPWPAFDREFLLHGEIKKVSENVYTIFAKSVNDENLIDDDHVQADVFKLNLTLTKIDDEKTKIVFEFFGDMKGWIPVWLMNLIQKKWPLRFIQSLEERNKLVNNKN